MKICRFNEHRLGVVVAGQVLDVTEALAELPVATYPLPGHDLLIANLEQVKRRCSELVSGARAYNVEDVSLLSPIANPGKIVAAPVNYVKHLEEARADEGIHFQNQIEAIQKVGLFLKATSSVVGPSEGVTIRHAERRNDHEIELVAVIGKKAKDVKAADALQYVAGYAIGLDMTVRGPQERSMRKSIDSFTVVGPWLVTADELTDPANLDFKLTVNGETRQQANTRDLILNLPQIIELASQYYTLMPGDLIFTGTPEGVGPVVPGDRMVAEISGIGKMTVGVRG